MPLQKFGSDRVAFATLHVCNVTVYLERLTCHNTIMDVQKVQKLKKENKYLRSNVRYIYFLSTQTEFLLRFYVFFGFSINSPIDLFPNRFRKISMVPSCEINIVFRHTSSYNVLCTSFIFHQDMWYSNRYI